MALVDLGPKRHGCEVSASASAFRNVDGHGVYVFSIGLDSTASAASSERTLEFVSTPEFDATNEIAATNQGYSNLSGVHTFNFLVRKSSVGDVDTTVTNATITLVCADRQL